MWNLREKSPDPRALSWPPPYHLCNPKMKALSRRSSIISLKETFMAVSPVPPGFHTVTPHLVIRGAAKAIEFYKKAFGATEVMIMPGPDGKGVMHAELKIGDSIIFLADEWPGGPQASPEKYGGTTVSIHLYVPNCDATFNQAVAAGAKAEMPPMNMFWTKRQLPCMMVV
jgi:uncharacterized glyoxalase superfamily protein PhnB